MLILVTENCILDQCHDHEDTTGDMFTHEERNNFVNYL